MVLRVVVCGVVLVVCCVVLFLCVTCFPFHAQGVNLKLRFLVGTSLFAQLDGDARREAAREVRINPTIVKESTGHTHTGHTDRENTPDTGTHTRTTRPPNEHLPQALNNAQRWRPYRRI